MAQFPDVVRRRALEKADFRCVLCRERIARDVHHIVPPADRGTEDEENAAPLCVQCHEDHGNDPSYRTHIRHARDDWYLKVAQRYQPAAVQVIDKAYFSIVAAEEEPGSAPRLDEAKGAVTEYYDTAIKGLTRLRNAAAHADDIADLVKGFQAITSATALSSATTDVSPGIVVLPGSRKCSKCQRSDILSDAAFCPGCGSVLPKTP